MKKNVFVIPIVFLFSVVLLLSFSQNNYSKSYGNSKYVGVDGCTKACHKSDASGKQLDIWKGSKHSQAYNNLATPDADKIAQDKGFSTPAIETPACLKCHVLGKDIDPSELTDGFKKEDGVQCETCHGPGSEYKSLSIMKDKQKAIDENGLIIPDTNEKFCTQCHNTDSPTFKGFNYDESWAKIAHKKP
ncbi:MAG TPA: cytochrome c family protein [Ignavibacteria bacterium]